jgi:hypothetical protein
MDLGVLSKDGVLYLQNRRVSCEVTVALLRTPASRYETPAWVDLAEPEVRERLSAGAIRSVARLSKAWGVTVEQLGNLLGGVAPSTWYAWKGNPPGDLGVDRLTRISYLLGIYTALHVLHDDALADAWPTRPNSNPLFAGEAPLNVMISGGIPALAQVRALLDSRRGGA